MKKLLLRTLPLLLIFCLLCPMNAIADTGGSGNIDGGGGGMGEPGSKGPGRAAQASSGDRASMASA